MTPRCSEQLKLTMTNASYRMIWMSLQSGPQNGWSTKWLLTSYPGKCKIMHIGKPLEQQLEYTLHDGTIRHELG